MFYISQDKNDNILRFGDVIEGFYYFLPSYENYPHKSLNHNISISKKDHFVVLTPCCSIEHGFFNLAPLNKVDVKILSNPFFEQDLLRINNIVPPEKSVPPKIWNETMDEDEKQRRIEAGPDYVFNEKFIYSESDLLPPYTLDHKTKGKINMKFYMINFKESFTISSKIVQRDSSYPKILQLTEDTRQLLKLKIAKYFVR